MCANDGGQAPGNEALGVLERVDLRKVWEEEDKDFTPWLAKEDNIALLSKAIGAQLEVEDQEVGIGPFKADIVCRNRDDDGSYVLVENQLERSDHTHLGQLLTYAAGLDEVTITIVWIARTFTEQHRAALDWLNEVTSEGVRLFGIEVELWRIGTSPSAPHFNIVAKPNDWTKPTALTEAPQLYQEYWRDFGDVVRKEGGCQAKKPDAGQLAKALDRRYRRVLLGHHRQHPGPLYRRRPAFGEEGPAPLPGAPARSGGDRRRTRRAGEVGGRAREKQTDTTSQGWLRRRGPRRVAGTASVAA